jgi:hypothetical protein
MITAQQLLNLLKKLESKGWDLEKTPIIFDDYENDKVFTQLDYDSTMGVVYINDMRDYE